MTLSALEITAGIQRVESCGDSHLKVMSLRPVSVGCCCSGDKQWSVEIYASPTDIEREWRAFEVDAVGTLFQSYRWVSAWCQTAADPLGERPVITVGRDADGAIAFILPLAIVRRFGFQTLIWLGQSQSAYNIGLYRPDAIKELDEAAMRQMLAVVLQAFPGLSYAHLTGQPLEWEGHRNPIAALPHEPRENCYAVPLVGDFNAVCAAQLSSDKRQDLRRQWRRLAEEGKVAVSIACTDEERLRALETFSEQKSSWIASEGKNNLLDYRPVRRFFEELARGSPRDEPWEMAQIEVDGRVVSTINGLRYKDRFYHLNGSIADTPLRRWSLGQLLIHDLVGRAAVRGVRHWDFGPGEGQHKRFWRPTAIPTVDTALVFRTGGAVPKLIDKMGEHVVARVHDHPRLLESAKRVRSWFAGAVRRLQQGSRTGR